MTKRWQSLYSYFVEPENLAETFRECLKSAGYTLYDPFGGIPGQAYPTTVKTFIAPPADGWTRILVEGTVASGLCPQLSHRGLLLSVVFDETRTSIETYTQGEAVEPFTVLQAHLRENISTDHLKLALSGDAPPTTQKQSDDIPLDVLPDDVQSMAQNLNSKHIRKMFNKLMKGVNKRVSGDSESALDLLRGNVDWSSAGGRQVQALMHCLTIPDPYWRTPDFVTLRESYQLHKRLQKNPKAMRYPGDDAIMHAVANALDYIPVYGGMQS